MGQSTSSHSSGSVNEYAKFLRANHSCAHESYMKVYSICRVISAIGNGDTRRFVKSLKYIPGVNLIRLAVGGTSEVEHWSVLITYYCLKCCSYVEYTYEFTDNGAQKTRGNYETTWGEKYYTREIIPENRDIFFNEINRVFDKVQKSHKNDYCWRTNNCQHWAERFLNDLRYRYSGSNIIWLCLFQFPLQIIQTNEMIKDLERELESCKNSHNTTCNSSTKLVTEHECEEEKSIKRLIKEIKNKYI